MIVAVAASACGGGSGGVRVSVEESDSGEDFALDNGEDFTGELIGEDADESPLGAVSPERSLAEAEAKLAEARAAEAEARLAEAAATLSDSEFSWLIWNDNLFVLPVSEDFVVDGVASSLPLEEYTKRFYEHFEDNFDFLVRRWQLS